MINFTYIAFSFNRISLIGKDHGKLVEFFTKTSVKWYIAVTAFISVSLSVVKGFKYKINYAGEIFPFPIPFESDLWISFTWQKDAYLFTNLISDFLNYIVLTIINLVLDVYMVFKLKKTLQEKLLNKILMFSLEEKSKDKKESQYNDAVNKAIKMVLLNNVMGIVFKLPFCLKPLVNTIMIFYYKDSYRLNQKLRRLIEFFNNYNWSGFADLIPSLTELTFTLSISIQLFIYKQYDTKFMASYDHLSKKDK